MLWKCRQMDGKEIDGECVKVESFGGTIVNKVKRTMGQNRCFGCNFFPVHVVLSVCLFYIAVHGRLHVTAALYAKSLEEYMFTPLDCLRCKCAPLRVPGRKLIQASARWHCCVVYLSNQCPFSILHLFLSHGLSLSSSNQVFSFTTHLSPVSHSPFFLCTACIIEPVAQLVVEHRIVQSESTWGSQGRPKTEFDCNTHLIAHTLDIYTCKKKSIITVEHSFAKWNGPFKKRSQKGNDKGTSVSLLSMLMYNCWRKAYVTLRCTPEDKHLLVKSRAADQWQNELVYHVHDRTHESSRLTVAIRTIGQVIVQCWWRLLWHNPADLDAISHRSALIKGNELGLRQKEFSQLLQFNIYFQLHCSLITGSAPPC